MRSDNWPCSYPRRGPNRRELIKPDGLLLSAVAEPRIDVIYRFLIKINPRAATSLRLSRPLVKSAVNLTTRNMKRFGSICMNGRPLSIQDSRRTKDTRELSAQRKTYSKYIFASTIRSFLPERYFNLSSLWMLFQEYFIICDNICIYAYIL